MTRTDDIDTSPEAVERIARALSERRGGPLNSPFDPLSIEAAALLRQLAKEKAELEAKINSMLTIPEVAQIIAVGPKPAALITPKPDDPTTT